MRDVLLFLETSLTGNGPLFFACARRLGLKPVLVSTHPVAFQHIADFESLLVGAMDCSTIVKAIDAFGRDRVAGVCSPLSQWAERVAQVAEVIGCPHSSPEAVAICRDKFRTREVLAEAGIRDVAFRSASTGAEAEAAAKAIGGLVIVKPREASGATGVRICHSPKEVRDHVDHFVRTMPKTAKHGVSVEEYIEGPQFGIELFDLIPIAIRRKHISPPPASIPIGLDCPPMDAPEVCKAVVDHAIRATRATGYVHGPAHVEVRSGQKGPCIIEINPRIVGGVGAESVRLACGVDLVEATIRFSCGMPYSLDRKFERASVTRYLLRRDVVALDVAGREEAMKVKGVSDVGVYAHALLRGGPALNYMDRIAYVVSEGATTADAVKSANEGLRRLEIIPERALGRVLRKTKKKFLAKLAKRW